MERLRTPLPRRERLLVVGALAAAVVAVVVAAAVHAARGHSQRHDCVSFSVPSTMGGANLRECGAAARRFCLTQGRTNRQFAAACRAARFATRP
jgi:hypothetical protein